MLPLCIPGLRTSPELLKMTDPAPMVRNYTVREMDVKEREKEIIEWDKASAGGTVEGSSPELLKAGQVFERTYILEQRSIFWTKGIKPNENGGLVGGGNLNVELVLLDKLGFDLIKNSNALNQTIRILIRTIAPFVILVIVSLLTKPDDKKRLDRFFVKMKTRVIIDRNKDNEELSKSYADPRRFDHIKLFRDSNWEFDRWDREDTVGFAVSIAAVFGIIGVLFLFISIGG